MEESGRITYGLTYIGRFFFTLTQYHTNFNWRDFNNLLLSILLKNLLNKGILF